MSRSPTRRRFLQLASTSTLALALAGTPARARAAEVEVSLALGANRAEVGQALYLQVQVSTDGRRIGDPEFSGIDALELSGRGTSSGRSIEIINGRRSQRTTKTFTYVVTAREAGEYEIGVEVEVDGQPHKAARKAKLTITGEALQAQVESGKAGDVPQDPSQDVIVWPVVDKARAYVGEQIVYELQIWERRNLQLEITSAPTFKDFWSENLLPEDRRRRMRPRQAQIGNTAFVVHQSIVRALFPQKAGTLTIGGPEIQSQQPMGLFGGGGGLPRTHVGRTLAIEVMPLPAEGQPANFRPNNVGQFGIAAKVDRTALRQGEAVRLSLEIAGTGNIALIEAPALPEIAGLRAYEAKPETPRFSVNESKLEGSRVYTVLMVAEGAGELTIPALELPFFNPETERYEVSRTKPIVLQVEADPDAAPAADAQDERAQQDRGDEDDELLAPPIAGGELVRTTPRKPWLSRERWWIGTLTAPALIGLGWIAGKVVRRYAPDERRRARIKEMARRRTLLAEAAAAVESGEGFYPKLADLLQAAAIGRAGNDGVGLTRERLIRLLGERGVANDELTTLRELLDECDAARFGAGSGDVDQRREHLDRARQLLDKRAWEPS